ncbi:hypothetical protein GJ496_007754 [Pomphorhynchus laevis]|nr:hypothetical protein GJ496_007754 [Pomphorhynchus laevis]
MKKHSAHFSLNSKDLEYQFTLIESILYLTDRELYEYTRGLDSQNHLYFTYRWLILEFKREFSYEDIILLWEIIWAADQLVCKNFSVFIAAAIIKMYRRIILDNAMQYDEILRFFNEMSGKHCLNDIITNAKALLDSIVVLVQQVTSKQPVTTEEKELLKGYTGSKMYQNDHRVNQSASKTSRIDHSSHNKHLFRNQPPVNQPIQPQSNSSVQSKTQQGIHSMRQSQILSNPVNIYDPPSAAIMSDMYTSIHQQQPKHSGTSSVSGEQSIAGRTLPNSGFTFKAPMAATTSGIPATQQQLTAYDVPQDMEVISADQSAIVDDQSSANKLVPLEINFLLKENREAHRTAEYDYPYLILRRGQPFYISVRFDKPFDPTNYILTLQFTLGSQSLISKGTHIRIPVNGTQSLVSGWKADFVKATVDSSNGKNIVKIEVNTSSTALIGRYKVYLETQYRNEKPCLFRYAEDVPLILNPFCKDDSCYMEGVDDVNEYVLNEDGLVYLGTAQYIVPRAWYFGQFQFPCLDIALWLIERANLPYESRGNVYQILRSLAAMINGGDRGMLESTKYGSSARQGFDPNEWIGSVKIAKKFMEQRGQPVRYGCSWTFSAVFCTLARSLGIPCRVVTAFNTVHDSDLCSTVDIHWDRNHRPVTQLNKDVININHTWNEMWFKRDDIPAELNGWQIVDSMGVSASESLYRLGPYPVKAIKKGDAAFLADGHLFFAMINNYLVHWIAERNGDMVPILIEDDYLAHKFVTKSVNNNQYVDITNTYKDGESELNNSPFIEERRLRLIENYKLFHSDDVQSKVYIMQESSHGDTVVLTWTVHNQSNETRTCEFYMNSYFSTIDGRLISECKELRGDAVILNTKEERQFHMKIRAEDYSDKIRPYHLLKIFSQLYVVETGQTRPVICDFDFECYDMIKLVPDKSKTAYVEHSFPIKIQISNPLKRLLQNCTLHIEGIGTPRTIILERALRPLEVTVYQTNIIPNKTGLKQLYVGFSCSILNNIYTTTKIEVQEGTSNGEDEDVSAEQRTAELSD